MRRFYSANYIFAVDDKGLLSDQTAPVKDLNGQAKDKATNQHLLTNNAETSGTHTETILRMAQLYVLHGHFYM